MISGRNFLPAMAMMRTLLRMKYRYMWNTNPPKPIIKWVAANTTFSSWKSEILYRHISGK